MMKRIVIFIFSFAITLQSMLGQFLLFDLTSRTVKVFPSVISNIVDYKKTDITDLIKREEKNKVTDTSIIDQNKSTLTKSYTSTLGFIRDTSLEHLFSPSSCLNVTGLESHIFSTYLYEGNFINFLAIEDKINYYIVLYSVYFKIICIGLPLSKLIYPFHSFY